MNIYIRQSKKNTKRIIILSLIFANSAGFPELLIINGYIGKFLKTSKKTNKLQAKSRRSIQNHQTKGIEESEMNWNAIMTLMLMTNVCYVFAANLILNQLSSTLITDARGRHQILNI
jgi:hypothetical protein